MVLAAKDFVSVDLSSVFFDKESTITKCIFSRYRFANTNGYCAGTSRLPRAFNFRARV